MFTATLDTSVLWPSLQRDFLLSLAVESAYRPTWSSVILDELEFHEEAKLVKRGMPVTEAAGRAATLIAAMRREFADAEVEGWEPLEGTFGLPDSDDEHVVAAAVIAGAGVIVTENLKTSLHLAFELTRRRGLIPEDPVFPGFHDRFGSKRLPATF